MAKWIFWLLALLAGVGLCFREAVSKWGDSICPWARSYCRDVPFVVGFSVLLLLWALYRLLSGLWNPLEVIRGVDKRWSTSKCQFFLWTVVALFCYASFYAERAGQGWLDLKDLHIPQNLLLAMGLSVTTAIAAKGITSSQVSNGTISKTHVGTEEAQTSDLIQDDGGAIDLTKVQMLGWTVIAVGAYMANAAHTIRNMAQTSDLPDIDMTLMVLMGLGQGAYLAKKMVVNSTPTITGIEPANCRPGREVKLTGTLFGTTKGDSTIAIDGVAVQPPALVKLWSDTSIIFVLPGPPLPAGWSAGQKAVSITLDGGVDSNSVRAVLLALGPQVHALTVVGNSLTLAGVDFGTERGSIRINDKPAGQITGWTDTLITFANFAAPASLAPGATVSVKLFLPDLPDAPAYEDPNCTLT